jgi:hypothetical protein
LGVSTSHRGRRLRPQRTTNRRPRPHLLGQQVTVFAVTVCHFGCYPCTQTAVCSVPADYRLGVCLGAGPFILQQARSFAAMMTQTAP